MQLESDSLVELDQPLFPVVTLSQNNSRASSGRFKMKSHACLNRSLKMRALLTKISSASRDAIVKSVRINAVVMSQRKFSSVAVASSQHSASIVTARHTSTR